MTFKLFKDDKDDDAKILINKILIKYANELKFEEGYDEDGGILISFTVSFIPNKKRKYYGYVSQIFRDDDINL